MEINNFSLNPYFARVFPTFQPGSEWIDLKDKSGRTDGIKQPNEILESLDDAGNEYTEINDYEIVSFLRKNIQNVPENKIRELFPLLLDYIRENPMGGNYCDGESSFRVKETLGIIITYKPEYISSVCNLLSSSSFLLRWAGVEILALSELEDDQSTEVKEMIESLSNLYNNEQSKKIINEEQNIKTTYYQVHELYAEYLGELKSLVDYFNKSS